MKCLYPLCDGFSHDVRNRIATALAGKEPRQ
jgi:hypothetical protein